jgi:hypothetical protein
MPAARKPQEDLVEYLSLREAMNLFAPKDSVAAVSTLISALTDKFEGVVPRREHDLHWQMDEEFKTDMKQRFDKLEKTNDERSTALDKKIDDIKEKQVPPWLVLGVFQLAGMILSAGITYGLHAVLPPGTR